MKKLLIALVSVALVVCTVFTGAGLGVILSSIDWEDIGDHFNRDKKTYTLTIVTGEGGHVNGSEASYEYEEGSLVNLSAAPDEGYLFAGWYGTGNSYLTTAKDYSFIIDRDTTLKASFAPKPEDMKGEQISYDELFDCSENFSFTIHCDREDAETYLLNNLTIVDSDLVGTEWEEQGKAAFTVERVEGTNEYRISPVEDSPYQQGATYVATLPVEEEQEAPEGSFVTEDNTSGTMNFTIEKEQVEEIEYQDDILFLVDSENPATDRVKEIVDDGLADGDPGDQIDYIEVYGSLSVATDRIICVYSGASDDRGAPLLDENSFFGKVLRTESVGGNTRVYYGLPELAEIYSKLDVYDSGSFDLEEAGAEFDEETIEQIRYLIMTDEGFQNFVATAQQTAVNRFEGTEYEVEMLRNQSFADMLTLKIVPKIWGNKASINIEAGLNIWIYKKGTSEKVAQLSFRMLFEKEMEFTKRASIALRYWWFIPTGVSSYDFNIGAVDREKLTLGVSFSYDTGTDGFATLDKDCAEEQFISEFNKLINGNKPLFQSIKDTFDENGYKAESDLRIRLFALTFRVGIVSFTIDTSLFLRFDISANAFYSVSTVDKMTMGFRSENGRPKRYQDVYSSATSSTVIFAGKADIRGGVRVEGYLSFVGLSKYLRAGIGFEFGNYFTVAGCVSLNAGQYAGFMEVGFYWKADVFYKVFSMSGEWELAGEEYPLFSYGYEQALMAYNYQKEIEERKAKIQMINSSMQLLNSDLLSVAVLDAEKITVNAAYLKHDADQYTVTVKLPDNSNFTYDAATGTLAVKAGAPTFFEEDITISVATKAKSAWTWFADEKMNSFLPTISVRITFGDADAYYDAIDSEIEKQFRDLYQSYNAETAEVLRANFDHLINNAIELPEEYGPIVEGVVGTYINLLFDTIASYKAKETVINKQEFENKFVYGEADVFSGIMAMMGEIMEEQEEVTVDTLYALLEDINKSEVMHGTLIEVAYSGACDKITENFAKVNEEAKEEILSIVEDYEAAYAADEKALALADAFRHILGLEVRV